MSTDRYLNTLKRVLILVLLYSFCRLLFLLFNYQSFSQASGIDILLSFLYGLRFDLSIIFSSNLPFIILSILPFRIIDSVGMQRFLKILFFVVNIPLLFMNLADIEYFKFTMKRTGFDVTGILGDVQNQGLQLALYYWYVPLILFIMAYAMIRLYKAAAAQSKKPVKTWISWTIFPIVVLFSILIIRGGFQYKPLKPDHAFVQTPNILGNLVLNTPYNFFTTMSFPRVENLTYYSSDAEVRAVIKRNHTPAQKPLPNTNVVVIILESFSREYMGNGKDAKCYMPFLDSLAKAGIFFDHHFANGKRSIEAVPSICASVPALMEEPYITGIYQSNEIHGLAELLSKKGYRTGFFHGGRNGTMGFDKFSINAGFQNYYGLDEYPEPEKDFDGNWGIYDEPYLQYFCKTISAFPKPFMAGVFTLSSHQPYSVPEKYKGVFPKGELDIHESIGYADQSLRSFFLAASKENWYNNTLFILTADHTQSLITPQYQNSIGEYRVPLVLFHPGKKIDADTSKVSQHVDIMPTVLDYVGIQNDHPLLFGRSLLDEGEGRALYYMNKNYFYVKSDYYLVFDGNLASLYAVSDWARNNEIKDKPQVKAVFEKELKAYLQYYNNGLNNNSWYR